MSLFDKNINSVVSRSVGTYHFDVVTAEAHESNLRLTSNPVESGAQIADHAILEPAKITIAGVVVGYEPPRYAQNALKDAGYDLDDYPMPMELKAITNQGIATVNRYIGQAKAIASTAQRMLAPWLPDYLTESNDDSDSLDRVGKAHNDLLAMQRSGELIDIQTGIKLYKNMAIRGVSAYQVYDGSAEITLTCEEVFIVTSKKTGGINVQSSKKTGQQASATKNKGKTSPKEDKSALAGMFG